MHFADRISLSLVGCWFVDLFALFSLNTCTTTSVGLKTVGIERFFLYFSIDPVSGWLNTGFSSKSPVLFLQSHRRQHNKDKPFKCHNCNRGYTDAASLEVHLSTHTVKHAKLFSCGLCNRSYTSVSLQTHQTNIRHCISKMQRLLLWQRELMGVTGLENVCSCVCSL